MRSLYAPMVRGRRSVRSAVQVAFDCERCLSEEKAARAEPPRKGSLSELTSSLNCQGRAEGDFLTPSLSARRRAFVRVSSSTADVLLATTGRPPLGFLGRSPARKNTCFPFLCPRSLPSLYWRSSCARL